MYKVKNIIFCHSEYLQVKFPTPTNFSHRVIFISKIIGGDNPPQNPIVPPQSRTIYRRIKKQTICFKNNDTSISKSTDRI